MTRPLSPTPPGGTPLGGASPASRLSRAREILDEAGRNPVGAWSERPRAQHTGREHDGPSAVAAEEDDDASRPSVDPLTRLAFARLASGASGLLDPEPAPPTAGWRGVMGRGATLFPAPRQPGQPSRFELSALGAALVGAAVIGAALPHAQPVQAQQVAAAAALTAAAAPAAPAAAAPAADDTSSASDSSATDTAADDTSAAGDSSASDTPAASTKDGAGSNDDPKSASSDAKDAAGATPDDGSDPLAGGGNDHLTQVALVIVHGDAPARWATAAPGTPARKRAALGTTLTGFAQVPGAPLAAELGLIAGQQVNPATRAGCDAPTPVVPGTVDGSGRVAGIGCDYPAGTPSLPGAIAIDGRRWRAYASVAADQAAPALCGTGTPTGEAAEYARTSALRRLSDLATSGACTAAAAPLSDLPKDLAADDAPAWLVIEVGACSATGCSPEQATARDQALDQTIGVLTAKAGLGASSAVIVVGDGAGPIDGLPPAAAGTVPASPDDPAAPAAVGTGALLIGKAVTADTTDPLALSPFALAKTQASWLGVDAPGWANADGVTPLAVPSS